VETAQRFYPDTLSQQHGARLYRSGDRVRQHFDGVLEFLGRNDHQVKIRGHRIELSEIERQLSSHPAVIACAVLVQQEQAGAAQNAQLIACVASNNGDESQLQYFLEQRLPAYMVPNRWMLLDQLPITANGKVNRQALQQLANEHDHQQQQRPEYVAPRSAAETVLCQLCAELMKVDQVGIRDNFFHLGGDSILSLQLVARAAKQGVEITPQELFDHPTIEDAAAIARECDPNAITQQSNTQATTPTSDDSSHIDVDLDDDELAALMGEIE
jgi:aryl carrier-like protein